MKNMSLLAVVCLLTSALYAQNPTSPAAANPSPAGPARFTLQGRAIDTSAAPLPASTVMLLSPKDSSLVNFGRADEKGQFTFKNLKAGPYILKISFVGFIPYNQVVKPTGEAVVDLGTLKLKPITRELMEVVVRTAKAPLTIKGDTIEYNASSFKVPPGSTVEDLLRKLPGVQVDQDGNIQAQGQKVQRVTVDGKNFFGNDPKQATKNLPAEAITKVQVFNDKTDQAKLTGVDDGKKEKTVNLELKEEFKKGGFGKVTAAAGPASNNLPARAEVKGSYNKFNAKNQFSLVGLGNNTNQQGLSREDYQDFRGSNAYNGNQNADFGFSGNYFYFSDSGDEGLGIPVSGRQGVGFSNNAGGGINYNYDTKEKKLSGSYYYNQTRLELNAERRRDNTLPQNEYRTDEISNQINFNGNHRVSLRYEKQIDTLNSLVFIDNSRYGVGNAYLARTQNLTRSNGAVTTNTSTNRSEQRQFNTSNSLIFRHKMRSKKGRSLAASATYEVNTNDASLLLDSQNTYSGPINPANQSADIHQDQQNNIVRNEYKASLQYIEPFAKRFTWETFYNFSLRFDEVNRTVVDRGERSARTRNDSLSLSYKNNYVYNRLGSSIRYSYKGLNLSGGLAAQRFTLNGRYQSYKPGEISRVFTTLIPNIGLNYDLKNNRYLYGGYNVSVQIPTSRDLQPVVNNSNPLFINIGNPDLLPQLGHNLNLSFNYFNPGSFINAYIGVNGTKYVNQIVYSQNTDTQTLVTTIQPENLPGGYNAGTYVGFGFPLKKTKATLDLNTNIGLGSNPVNINRVRNETRSQNYNAGARLSLTPVEWLTFYGNANVGVTNTQFSISPNRNQSYVSNNFSGELTLKLPRDLYINTNLNYRVNRNAQLNFDQRIPIWNASLYHILGKAKRAEIRLTVIDLLNRNVAVSLNRGPNYTQSETIQTLARYFTVGFTYNMRGVQAKMRREGFF